MDETTQRTLWSKPITTIRVSGRIFYAKSGLFDRRGSAGERGSRGPRPSRGSGGYSGKAQLTVQTDHDDGRPIRYCHGRRCGRDPQARTADVCGGLANATLELVQEREDWAR